MPLDQETWSVVSPLLDEALDLSPGSLESWLKDLCARQPMAGQLLRDLLARRAALETADFLESLPVLGSLVPALDDADGIGSVRPGDRVGPYVLEREIGRGGMAEVWRASADISGVRRIIALKLLDRSGLGAELRARFARERDILAALEHARIARLYDAGTTDAGLPYLALEFVDGQPLDRYCDEHNSPLRDRIEVFRQVLDAVAFAHSRLVVHRDLKPSNVLVTTEGNAILLDFGVAKLLQTPGTNQEMNTEISIRVMTPRYAAPEQITGGVVTTATDVYALGVMLYELLSGQPPYRPARESRRALENAILESTPPAPSQVVTAAAAPCRGTTLARLRAAMRGDLDTIVLKALKKSPAERYLSVQALSDDLQRYLSGQPVLAQSDTLAYRVRKFIGRHRIESALAIIAVASLASAVVGLNVQLGTVTRERDRANRLAQFMTHIFQVSNPTDESAGRVTARDLLDRASQEIETSLGRDPEQRAQLTVSMARSYTNLGAFNRAEQLLRSERERAGAALGESHAQVFALDNALLSELFASRQFPAAVELGRDLLEREARVLGPEHPQTAETETWLAHVSASIGKFAEASDLIGHALRVERRSLDPGDMNLLESEADEAFFRFRAGKTPVQEVEQRLQDVVRLFKARLGPGNARTISAENRLGVVLAREGRFSDEAALLRTAVADGRQAFGSDAYVVADSLDNLSAALLHLGDLAGAEIVIREDLGLNKRLHGAGAPRVALPEYNLACLLARSGKRKEAMELLETSIAHGLVPDAAMHMDSDSDLQSLWEEPRFKALLTRVRTAPANAASPPP